MRSRQKRTKSKNLRARDNYCQMSSPLSGSNIEILFENFMLDVLCKSSQQTPLSG